MRAAEVAEVGPARLSGGCGPARHVGVDAAATAADGNALVAWRASLSVNMSVWMCKCKQKGVDERRLFSLESKCKGKCECISV